MYKLGALDAAVGQSLSAAAHSSHDFPSFASRCFVGNRAVVTTQPSVTPPAKYSTAFTFPSPPTLSPYNRCAINGLTIPNSRPQKLATPHAVPRTGAGNASGVHPYSTALNMLWKKYSKVNNPRFLATVSTVAKRMMLMPISAAERVMVHLRPMEGMRYMVAPRRTPRMPGAYVYIYEAYVKERDWEAEPFLRARMRGR